MRDTGHTAVEAVQEALRAGRLAEARERATTALEEHGPDPELYALLGRAHAAEDEDDHDDAAERAYRRGLAAFPDDLPLLTAYAELCRASDALDRPGRAARATGLVERVNELAPGSPEALRLSGRTAWTAPAGRPPVSPAHIQRHDVRQALAAAPSLAEAARLAAEEAGRHPYSVRLAVRAETLTAFTRPGRWLLLGQVRAPYLSALVVLAMSMPAVLLGPTTHWYLWAAAGLLALIPNRLLGALESGARSRATAATAPLPEGAPEPASPLPDPPPPGFRDFAVLGTALTCLLVSTVAAVAPPAPGHDRETKDYPRYEVAAPKEFRGARLASAVPAVDGVDSAYASLWTETVDVEGAFAYLYGELPPLGDPATADALIIGMTGDFRGAPDSTLKSYELGLSQSDSTIDEVWRADAGPDGRLRCVSYATDSETPGSHVACTWLNDGSYGTVILNEQGLDHDTAAEAARTGRDQVLHNTGRTADA
ncbi:hypothetical protein [Streptomyces sp. NBC_00525]|uniref:hypothetical protein n=1 Tax=Streptomyces sp. NBC_00525 TaxID=2903660 RepID=UPI002E8047D0|nr:hypothetical protein [Streptomyces sp. NBC_00525]WUC94284.1 hypothetical protein OG710_12030 [Streptomyces sp. NBC_00525]